MTDSKGNTQTRGWIAAMGRYSLFYILAGIVLIVDQVTKFWIQEVSGLPIHTYPPSGGIEVISGFFSIVYTTNEGAAWGLFTGYGWALALLALAALTAIYYFRHDLDLHTRAMQLTFGLLCGGICGNLIDRAVHGHVIDFLDFVFFRYRFPTFNVADSGITVGVGIYLVCSIIEMRRESAQEALEASDGVDE